MHLKLLKSIFYSTQKLHENLFCDIGTVWILEQKKVEDVFELEGRGATLIQIMCPCKLEPCEC